MTEYEDQVMALKPMNCPGHTRSTRAPALATATCPVRYSGQGLHRYEQSSDAARPPARASFDAGRRPHLLHRRSDPGRSVGLLDFAFATYDVFGLDVRLELSTRPEVRIGPTSFGTAARRRCATRSRCATSPTTLHAGDGAFYGPKIDMHMTDSLGRSWQLGTVQLDYNMPERFGLNYTGADNAEHRPVMIHRALMGSYERFIGILLEHFAGELPLWLAPVQAIVLPIADRHNEYAEEVLDRLRERGMRVEVDERTESMRRKIRDAELRKIPFMLVVGDRDRDSAVVSVREHHGGDAGAMPVDEFAARIEKLVKSRTQR